jgi:putative thiamine transport system permease protein
MHWFLYLPLLLPQISFMAGVHLLMVILHVDGMFISLVWSHVLFVLPYLFITLKATYQAFDPLMTRQALLLGRSYPRALFKVKLPMLLRPVLFSLAIGFSVSVAQYVPTLLAGAGRFATLTTEVVTLSGGSDRRIIAVYTLIQQMLPMIIYLLAIMIPKGIYSHKKGMS